MSAHLAYFTTSHSNGRGWIKLEANLFLVISPRFWRGTPENLLNLLWMNNTTMFGMRGGAENRQLKWGDLQLKKTESGEEYLQFSERNTKTRTGEKKLKHEPLRQSNLLTWTRQHALLRPIRSMRDVARHR